MRPPGTPPKTTLCATLYAQALEVDGATHRNLLLAHTYATPDDSWPEVQGLMRFDPKTIQTALHRYGLDPRHTPLSVIVIEFLPRGGSEMVIGDFNRDPASTAASRQGPDPAGTQFPTTRILRTSTLTPVAAAC